MATRSKTTEVERRMKRIATRCIRFACIPTGQHGKFEAHIIDVLDTPYSVRFIGRFTADDSGLTTEGVEHYLAWLAQCRETAEPILTKLRERTLEVLKAA